MLDSNRPSRRGFLAAAGTVVATAGFATSAEASTSGYDTVVDLVAEGADPTGGESITPYLKRYAGDNTLIKLPEGRYRMTSQFRFCGFENFGIEGQNATIVPGNYWNWKGIACLRLGVSDHPGRDLRVSGLDFDFRNANTGVRAIGAQVSDGLDVEDIDVIGLHDSGLWGPALFAITDPTGSGRVKGFRAMDGGVLTKNAPGDVSFGPIGMLVPRFHRGELLLYHVNLAGWPNNGLYAGNANGPVHVHGGYYANSGVSNVRIGGDGSWAKWVTVVVDDRKPSLQQQPGIRLDRGSDLLVYECEIDLGEPNGPGIDVLDGVDSAVITGTDITLGPYLSPAIQVGPTAGKVIVKHTVIEANGSGYTVYVKGGSNSELFDMYYCNISGDASSDGGYAAIFCERSGAKFRYVYVDQPGGDGDHRRAIDLRGDDCFIWRGDYRSQEYPIVNHGSGTQIYQTSAYEHTDTQGLWTFDSDIELARSTIENGVLNEDSGSITAWDNSFPS